jgi:hypothetical protein
VVGRFAQQLGNAVAQRELASTGGAGERTVARFAAVVMRDIELEGVLGETGGAAKLPEQRVAHRVG